MAKHVPFSCKFNLNRACDVPSISYFSKNGFLPVETFFKKRLFSLFAKGKSSNRSDVARI